MPRSDKVRLALVALICLAVGSALSSALQAQAARERPVLRFLAVAAKTALWFFAFAEPPPEDRYESHPAEGGGHGVVHVAVDGQGNRIVEHGRGW